MIAQDDFGCLGIPDEAEYGVLLHVVDHPALSPKQTEKSLEDQEFRHLNSQESSYTKRKVDEAFNLSNLSQASKCGETAALPLIRSIIQEVEPSVPFENDHEPIRRVREHFRPARRFPRRVWIGLVKRMLQ
jgi:hypothetical protein